MGKQIDSSSTESGSSDPLSKPAHSLPYDQVVGELGSKIDEGLSTDEAARRLQEYGPNKLEDGKGISILKILVGQVANAMMLVKPTTFMLAREEHTYLILFFDIGPHSGDGGQLWYSVMD